MVFESCTLLNVILKGEGVVVGLFPCLTKKGNKSTVMVYLGVHVGSSLKDMFCFFPSH